MRQIGICRKRICCLYSLYSEMSGTANPERIHGPGIAPVAGSEGKVASCQRQGR
jgi:hypothetical protein